MIPSYLVNNNKLVDPKANYAVKVKYVEHSKPFTTPCEVCNAPSRACVGVGNFAYFDVETSRLAWLPYAKVHIRCPDADTEEHQENAGTFTISRTEFDAAVSEEEKQNAA